MSGTNQYITMIASVATAIQFAYVGELLYAYPSTGISTSQTTESMKMQLRVYLGSVLYDPNKILILPDVHLDGVTNAWTQEIAALVQGDGNSSAQAAAGTSAFSDAGKTISDDSPLRNEAIQFDSEAPQAKFIRVLPNFSPNDVPEDKVPALFHQGRVQKLENGKWSDVCLNRGHFGPLDDPDVMAMHGGYAYNRNVKP